MTTANAACSFKRRYFDPVGKAGFKLCSALVFVVASLYAPNIGLDLIGRLMQAVWPTGAYFWSTVLNLVSESVRRTVHGSIQPPKIRKVFGLTAEHFILSCRQ